MDTHFLLRGLLIGFSIAAVIGPIGLLCIARTLQRGFLYGFVTGLGAATADATYGSLAAFGLTVISGFFVQQQHWIRLFGGLFLLYLGIRTLLSQPAQHAATATGQGFLGAYTSTLVLTLTNPLTILSFAAIFAGLGVGLSSNQGTAAVSIVVGVFCGSGAWWLLLSGGVSLLREKMTPRWLTWVNRCAGLALAIFGLVALLSLLPLLL